MTFNQKFIFFIASLAFISFVSHAQNERQDEIIFEVNKVYIPLSISYETLKEAKTLLDLNKHYEAEWVSDYLSVEIRTVNNDQINIVKSKNDLITTEQMNNMQKADIGTDISVYVKYLPKNNLKENTPKETEFSFQLNPHHDAEFIGGEKELNAFLNKSIIDKLPNYQPKEFDITAVNFTVNESGQIQNVHIFESSKNKQVDQIIVESIYKMPLWKAATYMDGTKVSQQYVFTLGNLDKSCKVYTLNIRRDPID